MTWLWIPHASSWSSTYECVGLLRTFHPLLTSRFTFQHLPTFVFCLFCVVVWFCCLLCFWFLFCKCLGIPNSPRSLDLDDRQGLIARSAMQQKKRLGWVKRRHYGALITSGICAHRSMRTGLPTFRSLISSHPITTCIMYEFSGMVILLFSNPLMVEASC